MVFGGLVALTGEGRKIKKSPLDRVTIYRDSISRDTPIRVRRFATEDADLGTGSKDKNKPKYREIALRMQETAPRMTLEGAIVNLQAHGFADVAELSEGDEPPGDCLIVEGEFTLLNPGSQGKRYLVGFGAGKSKLCAAGKVVYTSGQVWMEFDHCRHEAWGLFGGDSTGQMSKDSHATGSHFAEFMDLWSRGKYAG